MFADFRTFFLSLFFFLSEAIVICVTDNWFMCKEVKIRASKMEMAYFTAEFRK